MTLTDLIGSLGGASGVFLGASLVSLLELLLATAACLACRRRPAPAPPDPLPYIHPPQLTWRLPRPARRPYPFPHSSLS